MKTIYQPFRTIAAAALMGMALVGCADFIDIRPKDLVTEDNFWDEKNDVEQSVAGVYTAMQNAAFLSRCIIWGESRSDNLYQGRNIDANEDLYNIERENILSTNGFTRWDAFYAVIDKCNLVIERAPQVAEKDPSYSTGDVNATIAEMSAIRDLCYFYLIRAFKDVPYYTHAIYEEKQVEYLGPTSFDQVLQSLIADLEQVKGNTIRRYPEDNSSRYNSNCNRITRNAVNAILADMYLWSGDYQKCVEACDAILNDKMDEYEEEYGSRVSSTSFSSGPKLSKYSGDPGVGYPLYADASLGSTTYGSAFDAIFGTGNSFESIFELSCNFTDGSNYVASNGIGDLYGKATGTLTDAEGILGVTDAIVTDLNASSLSFWYNKHDSRCFENISMNSDKTQGYVAKFVYNTATVSKQNNEYRQSFPQSMARPQDRNWIFYRLTDVMLMKAEALTQLVVDPTTDEDKERLRDAFYLIYPIEARSYMGNSPNSDLPRLADFTNAKSTMSDLILDVRQRELMFEGKRWFDLLRYARRSGSSNVVRQKVIRKFTAGVSGSGSASLFTNMESLYWPYNKEEVKRNPNLPQKEFYANETEESYKNSAK